MRTYDIIFAKRNGKKLSKEEIFFLIGGYNKNEIADYQMSAFLMAVYFSGLDDEEIFYLTGAMIDSGKTLDLSFLDGPVADKHSTGGVGDGTSLVVAPVAASCGIYVPMMSGRALGHTGGTLDKLEAIPGFNVNLNKKEFIDILQKNQVAMIGQTKEIAPVDKKLYALRDVTATVESIPLICASVMSKKIAEGAKNIILDVKTGSGAFMQKYDDSRTLASKMINAGKYFKKNMTAVISDMDNPLGYAAGNSLEVIQSIEVLKGNIKNDFYDLSVMLSAIMILSCGKALNIEDAKKIAVDTIDSGKALEKFIKMIEMQNGDPKIVGDYNIFGKAKKTYEIKADKTGYIKSINTRDIGIASCLLGAGRIKKEDAIDFTAGITLNKKISEKAQSNDVLAVLHYNDDKNLKQAVRLMESSYIITDDKTEKPVLIKEIIN